MSAGTFPNATWCAFCPERKNTIKLMLFLSPLAARDLGRAARGRSRKRPGAQFVPERKNTIKLMLFLSPSTKHCAHLAFLVPERKNVIKLMLFLSPGTKTLCVRFFCTRAQQHYKRTAFCPRAQTRYERNVFFVPERKSIMNVPP